jgi:hypothetical protein
MVLVTPKAESRGKKNIIDVILSNTSCFRMSLEGMEQGYHVRAIGGDALTFFVSVSKLVTNVNEGGGFEARGVGICIMDVTFVDDVV